MLRHVVMFRWVDGTTKEHVEKVSRGLDSLASSIAEIHRYEHGPDLGLNPGNHDYVVVADFLSQSEYLVYRDHPLHTAFIAEHLAPLIALRVAVQYRVD